MSRKSYIPGDVARFTLEVRTPAGDLVDAGSVQLTLQSASGMKTSVDQAVTEHVGIGLYAANFQIPFDARPGMWAWRWDMITPNAGASEGTFTVQRSLMT